MDNRSDKPECYFLGVPVYGKDGRDLRAFVDARDAFVKEIVESLRLPRMVEWLASGKIRRFSVWFGLTVAGHMGQFEVLPFMWRRPVVLVPVSRAWWGWHVFCGPVHVWGWTRQTYVTSAAFAVEIGAGFENAYHDGFHRRKFAGHRAVFGGRWWK